MAEATWQLRQRPRTLDRRVPDWRGARGEVGRCLWAWSIRLSFHCPAGAGFAPRTGALVDGYMVTLQPMVGPQYCRHLAMTPLDVVLRFLKAQPGVALAQLPNGLNLLPSLRAHTVFGRPRRISTHASRSPPTIVRQHATAPLGASIRKVLDANVAHSYVSACYRAAAWFAGAEYSDGSSVVTREAWVTTLERYSTLSKRRSSKGPGCHCADGAP